MASFVVDFVRLEFVTFVNGEYAVMVWSTVAPDPTKIPDEEDSLTINNMDRVLHQGRVCGVWETEVGTVIVHSVETSVSSAGGEADPAVARIVGAVKGIAEESPRNRDVIWKALKECFDA
jgi:hypothetical protein